MFSFLSVQEQGVRAALEEVSYLETGRVSVSPIRKEGPIPAVLWAPWVQTPNHDLSSPWRGAGDIHSPASWWGTQIMSQAWGDRRHCWKGVSLGERVGSAELFEQIMR